MTLLERWRRWLRVCGNCRWRGWQIADTTYWCQQADNAWTPVESTDPACGHFERRTR